MKQHNFLAMFPAFVVALSFSMNVNAADDATSRQENETSKNAQRGTMKKHSHMEDKGLPASDHAPAGQSAKGDRKAAGKDKSKHLHPRDGK